MAKLSSDIPTSKISNFAVTLDEELISSRNLSQVAKKVGMKVFTASSAEINLVGIVFSRLEISLKFSLLRSEKSE